MRLAPDTYSFDEKVKFYNASTFTDTYRAALIPRLTKYIKKAPTERQTAFLLLNDDYLEVMYGGAAAGGKTEALLMAALQYVDVPGYSALLLRRTYGQLNLSDSILNRAHTWLRRTDARWEAAHNRYIFPSGAILQFGYLQHFGDVYQYDSAAYQFIGFDELTQFTEPQYRFLFSRLRKKKGFPVPLRMRSATNPGGMGHTWVKDRFVKQRKTATRVFVPAKLSDNPYIDADTYRLSLSQLDPITRKQREEGDWNVEAEGAIFKREWFHDQEAQQIETSGTIYRVRFWDLAATKPKPGKDPDYTVGLKLARDSNKKFWIEDIVRARLNPGDVENLVHTTAIKDGRSVKIRMEQEPGASGKSLVFNYVRRLMGFDFKGYSATGSKIARWMPVASQCRANNVGYLSGEWNHNFFEELFTVPEGAHDDQVDALAGAFQYFTEELATYRPGISHI